MAYKANIYPVAGENPTLSNSDSSRANLGLCFSGGGSRALTCAWGQMLGLNTLGLMEKPRFISSVSGGTWASSIWAYAPDTISDTDLLGSYYPPAKLSLSRGEGLLDVNELGDNSFGQVPAGISVEELTVSTVLFLIEHRSKNHKWFWPSLVAKHVLDHYGLRAEGDEPWNSTKSFTLSESYATQNFPAQAPALSSFFFTRPQRPLLIMNDNIMQSVVGETHTNIVMLPNQVTPVVSSVKGQTPSASLVGGGAVESYGFTSMLDQNTAETSPVEVTIAQPYSLIDIVSCSSAFFAEAIAEWVNTEMGDKQKKDAFTAKIAERLTGKHHHGWVAKLEFYVKKLFKRLIADIEAKVLKALGDLDNILPSYNYWPLGSVSENKQTRFTDGGSLENTGILGMLAQTDNADSNQPLLNLLAFDNTSTPLSLENGKIIAGGQAAALFGIDFNAKDGSYQPFTDAQKDPHNGAFEPTSLITVFDNSADISGDTPFGKLVKGLYATNCGATAGQTPDDGKVNSAPAFHQMQVTTVKNSLANVTAGRAVNLLYLQNAKTLDWQNSIGDEKLRNEITKGQDGSKDPLNDFAAFKGFPTYSTFFKIGLTAKESNALSQMWAWSIADDASSLKATLQRFFADAE